eukprot:Sspe_Gene.30578::Locus_15115_Transcript_1_1_Confidence_1.000_Length_1976::g.30578::m.30578
MTRAASCASRQVLSSTHKPGLSLEKLRRAETSWDTGSYDDLLVGCTRIAAASSATQDVALRRSRYLAEGIRDTEIRFDTTAAERASDTSATDSPAISREQSSVNSPSSRKSDEAARQEDLADLADPGSAIMNSTNSVLEASARVTGLVSRQLSLLDELQDSPRTHSPPTRPRGLRKIGGAPQGIKVSTVGRSQQDKTKSPSPQPYSRGNPLCKVRSRVGSEDANTRRTRSGSGSGSREVSPKSHTISVRSETPKSEVRARAPRTLAKAAPAKERKANKEPAHPLRSRSTSACRGQESASRSVGRGAVSPSMVTQHSNNGARAVQATSKPAEVKCTSTSSHRSKSAPSVPRPSLPKEAYLPMPPTKQRADSAGMSALDSTAEPLAEALETVTYAITSGTRLRALQHVRELVKADVADRGGLCVMYLEIIVEVLHRVYTSSADNEQVARRCRSVLDVVCEGVKPGDMSAALVPLMVRQVSAEEPRDIGTALLWQLLAQDLRRLRGARTAKNAVHCLIAPYLNPLASSLKSGCVQLRKHCIFFLVELYLVLREESLTYLSDLSPTHLQLVQHYVAKIPSLASVDLAFEVAEYEVVVKA